MLTMKTRYALKALAHLATSPPAEPVLVAEIAEHAGVPRKFLELILAELRKEGFVRSKKGRGGGYCLAAAPEKIALASVMRVIDGPLAPVPCVSEKAYSPCEECVSQEVCGTRLVMKDVRDAVARILDATTIAAVLARLEAAGREGRADLAYSI